MIRECDAIAVGRPARRTVEITAIEVSEDFLRSPFGRAHSDLLLARHIGRRTTADGLAVR